VFTGSGALGVDRLFAKRSATAERTPAEQTPVTA
jgi:putative oxidoreductase